MALPEDLASRLDAVDRALDALDDAFEPFTSTPLQQVNNPMLRVQSTPPETWVSLRLQVCAHLAPLDNARLHTTLCAAATSFAFSESLRMGYGVICGGMRARMNNHSGALDSDPQGI
jgi:hypothetical protein